MKICPKCQNTGLPDNLETCFYCGYKFDIPKAPPQKKVEVVNPAKPQPKPATQPAPQPAPTPQPAPQPTPQPQPAKQPGPTPQPTPQPTPAQQPGPQPRPQPAPTPQPRPQQAPPQGYAVNQQASGKPGKKAPVFLFILIPILIIGLVGFGSFKLVTKLLDGIGTKTPSTVASTQTADGTTDDGSTDDGSTDDGAIATGVFDQPTTNVGDLEQQVQDIDEATQMIVDNSGSGIYEVRTNLNSEAYYLEGENVVAMYAPKGQDGKDYARFYFMENGNLIYVQHDGNPAYAYYFADGRMIRMIKNDGNSVQTFDANALSPNDETEFVDNENMILSDWANCLYRLPDEITVDPSSEYILDGSDSRYITENELHGLSKEELRIATNEIYARHGRKFNDSELQEYFNGKSWYKPTIEASDFNDNAILSNIEIANRDLLVKYQEDMGYR